MTPFDRHLQAASGYLELGLPLEADEELKNFELEMRTLSDVLVIRVDIYAKLERWELMEVVAKQLCHLRPDESQWPIKLAFSVRRCQGLPEALAILAQVANRFPRSPGIFYNLACYTAQLGNLDVAHARLAEAIRLNPQIRSMALEEPDLTALHERLKSKHPPRPRKSGDSTAK